MRPEGQGRVDEGEDESPTAVQEFPDRVETNNKSDETFIEDPLRDLMHTSKDLEGLNKLFQTIGNRDKPFPECLKGRYKEDPMFKPILENPSNFTDFKIKNDLIFF